MGRGWEAIVTIWSKVRSWCEGRSTLDLGGSCRLIFSASALNRVGAVFSKASIVYYLTKSSWAQRCQMVSVRVRDRFH